MKIVTRGKRAKVFGIIAFSLFAGAYGMYSYSTIRSIIKLARSSAEGSDIAMGIVSLAIELAFLLGIIYLCVDGIIKYFKDKPSGTFPHAIRVIILYALYSLAYPIYNKFLRPNDYAGFELIQLVTTDYGILLIIAAVASIASFFMVNKGQSTRHRIFAAVLIPVLLITLLEIIRGIPNYKEYWMVDSHLAIFGPLLRLIAYVLFIVSYLVEKKEGGGDDEIYIAYCGLNCKECEAYKATIHNDDALREEVAEKWSKLNNVTITKDMINCEGCKLNGKKTPFCKSLCKLKHCAVNRKLGYCKECEEYETCELAKPFKKPLEAKEKE